MFNAITWEAFLTTVILLAGGYYFITTLLLYHTEITSWVKSRTGQSPAIPTQPSEPIAERSNDNILGNVNVDDQLHTQRTSTVDADDLKFGVSDDHESEIVAPVSKPLPQADHLIIGSVADLLQEVKTLIQLITEYKSDKVESASLFRTLLLRYPHVKSTDYKDAISLYICQAATAQLPFTLSLEETMAWWESEEDQKK